MASIILAKTLSRDCSRWPIETIDNFLCKSRIWVALMDSSEERPVDGPPKGRWECLCHKERQLFCKNRDKMAAIRPRPSDSATVSSEAFTPVAQFVQRHEVNAQLHGLGYGLLSIGK
jgi:hypothetical protein